MDACVVIAGLKKQQAGRLRYYARVAQASCLPNRVSRKQSGRDACIVIAGLKKTAGGTPALLVKRFRYSTRQPANKGGFKQDVSKNGGFLLCRLMVVNDETIIDTVRR